MLKMIHRDPGEKILKKKKFFPENITVSKVGVCNRF